MSKFLIKDMLMRYRRKRPARFHIPGHKGQINSDDVTEISITDDLNNPNSYILNAQKSLSESYKSAESFFLVNGSTGGIHTMLKYASMQSQYPILISRNSHKSIISGCMLFNIETIVAEEVFDEEQQVFLFNQQKIIDYINNTKLAAVVVTSVDYFGRALDLSKISEACKQNNVLLLCDEAHGAHFHISPMLPESGMKYADICVQSAHKTLSALTQCSYIHISENVDTAKFKNAMYSLQTSSPSFLLIRSMDDARQYSEKMNHKWEKRIERADKLKNKLNSIARINIKGTQWALDTGYAGKDQTRLVIDVSAIGNGLEAAKILENDFSIFMEMATFKYLVAILTPWDKKRWDRRLIKGIKNIACQKLNKGEIPLYPENKNKDFKIENLNRNEWEKIRLENAANRVSVISIGAYPPGVPMVLPGETISKEIVEYLQKIENLGGHLFGIDNGYILCKKEEQ